jgi:pyridoxine/pyridoxamine 5'-phosphate oxidase
MNNSHDEKLKNLQNTEAVDKIKKLVESAQVCMFTTRLKEAPFNTRPMSPVNTDDEGCIWFFSDKSSNKNREITQNSNVQLYFSNNSSYEFLNHLWRCGSNFKPKEIRGAMEFNCKSMVYGRER